MCYKCGKEGHYARGCTAKILNNNWQNKSQGSQLRSLQAMEEGYKEEQDKKNVPEPNARIYAYTKGDAEAGGSKVVTCQLVIVNKIAQVLFDSGVNILLYLLCLLNVWIEIWIVLGKPSGRFYHLVLLCCQAIGYVL